MSDSIASTESREPSLSDIALKTISVLGTASGEIFDPAGGFSDLLRAASRHCKRLVDAERVRIWVLRRGGRTLVASEFGEGEAAVEHRIGGTEGLAGWAVVHRRSLRLAPGETPPPLAGTVPPFQSALVIPLFRRGVAFGAIECLDKRGGGAFSDADFDHLDVAAEHVGIALDNALLVQETRRRALEKEVLLEVAKSVATPLDLDEVIEAIFRALREVVSYDAAAIYLVNRSTLALELVREIGYPQGSEEAFGLQVGQGIVGWVAKTGEPLIVPDVAQDARYVSARPSTRSELAAPLVVGGRTIGVFNLESDGADTYHEGHLELVSAFAAQAAIAVERARLTRELLERRHLEKELAIARDIQRSFLPKSAPFIPGFDLAGTALAHDQVGGDYYDFIPASETRLGLAIADVSGKGIPAALIMAGFRMSLLAEIRNEFTIRAVLRKVNSLLHESLERERFVTAFYGVLDIKNRVLIYSNGGHNPPLLRRADGAIEYLTEGGVALGVLPDSVYADCPVHLGPGDLMVMFTDGISEAESPSGEQFGQLRIEEIVTRLAARSSQEIVEGLVRAVLDWAGERGPNDDLTLVVLKTLAAA
jgi:sigma-B regulation protein RsbU (phosphoserine phosphatase)